jgi:5-methylthioribose kinase
VSQTALTDLELPAYLRSIGIVAAGDAVTVEAAGDGNINWVRRARTRDGRSWIVKQARPSLERFPQYQASTERIVFEARYFATARAFDRQKVCPQVLHFDEPARVLVLEDLGDAERLDRALARGAVTHDAIACVAAFLGTVHAATRSSDLSARFANDDMRCLHGDHIFRLPFQANDFPLAPAVRRRAAQLQKEGRLGRIAAAAYDRYRESRTALVHADAQAGNILLTQSGPKLLDAEIAHVGDPAFDVGTLIAHVLLPAVGVGNRERVPATLDGLWSAYENAHGPQGCPQFAEAALYAGVEMMRRTIGAARVAVVETSEAALAVIDVAGRLMTEPPAAPDEIAPRSLVSKLR